ncbi:ankyrin repeat-containing domain protein [Lasiosphaeris hirsuta]|uniref:Ankyrin repeat-containing domain protein n=1 Tax=Lasiosphaeris hirsuta TaxID=260670 RepID=A0AA39ZRT7_9PEZI|nr:ankyrin repeat-containing domain protein [Lasiosphaeris hirsuta]
MATQMAVDNASNYPSPDEQAVKEIEDSIKEAPEKKTVDTKKIAAILDADEIKKLEAEKVYDKFTNDVKTFSETKTALTGAQKKIDDALETATKIGAAEPISKFREYLNERDTEGCSPLYLAALNGHTEVVEHLKRLGNLIDFNCKNGNGWSPLRAALSNDSAEVAALLLDTNEIEWKRELNDGWNAIGQASTGGHLYVVNLLLNTDKDDIDELDADGFTALYQATNAGHTGVVRLLLSNGASVDKESTKSKGSLTALFAASNTGNTELVNTLLKAKANVQVETSEGETPLSTALAGGHAAVVELLLRELQ